MTTADLNLERKKLFCFGYGYVCDFLGQALREDKNWKIAGTSRDSDKRQLMREADLEAFLFDDERPLGDPLYVLKDVTHLLISTPPGREGCPTYLAHGEVIASLPNLEWVGYLSSTCVYGDRDGDWVDEYSELRPSTIRGSRRTKAEEQWRSMRRLNNLPVHVFRLSGIYGPGRSALDSVHAGIARRIDKPGQVFGRVHVADIVQVLMASIAQRNAGAVYNICDDNPAPAHEVIAYACEILGKEAPPLVAIEDANLPPMALSFYSDNKRVRNERIKQELGVTLKYPDYRSGIDQCLEYDQKFGSIFDVLPE